MDSIEIFQIDAFTDKVFHGNPAAICLLSDWLNDELLRAIAVENNLSETAFVMATKEDTYQIRWFTLKGEISLCGHSTLAAAFVLFELGKCKADHVAFTSLSGPLTVRKKQDRLMMQLPKIAVRPVEDRLLFSGLVDKPYQGVYDSDLDYLIQLETEQQVMSARVDIKMLEKLPKRGLVLTSGCEDADFYSRCFYPKYQIVEDPVTGTAHCLLAPFWANKLGKTSLHGIQGAYRKGDVYSEVLDNSVRISGSCKWYSKGRLVI